MSFFSFNLFILLIQFLVIMPIPLYVAGKLMKLPIRYSQAIWITLFAGFIGGLVATAHVLVGFAVFLGILYYELNRTFHPKPQQTVIIILIDIAIVIGLEFIKPYLLLGGLSLI